MQVTIGPNGKSGIAPDSTRCRGRFYLQRTAASYVRSLRLYLRHA
nr:MAG TPA: hypothetical protein [Caudoviricetes sp.]